MRLALAALLTSLLLVPARSTQADGPAQPLPLGVLWALHLNLGYHAQVVYHDGLIIVVGDREALALDPQSLEEVWRLGDLGDEATQLLLDEGVLYLQNNRRLHAVDPRTGELRWQVTEGPYSWRDGVVPPADAGLLMANGRLYISAARHMWAVDPGSGRVLWNAATIPDNATGNRYGTPGLCDNVVVSRFINGDIVGVDAGTGETRWTFRIRFDWETDRFWVAGCRVYALRAYRGGIGEGRLYVLDGRTGQPLWSYPSAEDAAKVNGVLMIKDGVVYTFAGERLTALSTDTGQLLWQSQAATGDGYTQLFAVGDVILSSGFRQPAVASEARSGATLWYRDANERIVGVLSDTVFIEERPEDPADLSIRGPSDDSFLRLVDPVTGDSLHVVAMTLQLAQRVSVVRAGEDALLLYSRNYLYALGQSDPAGTLARARTFLERGDYRSAVHTLRLFKANDPEGYRQVDGESLAAAALTAWLDEAQALFDSGQIDQAYDLLRTEFQESTDLESEAATLEVRDALARHQYILAAIDLSKHIRDRSPIFRNPDQVYEYRRLREEYGDTEWARRIERLLPLRQVYRFAGWGWLIPPILPAIYFARSYLIPSRRRHLRELIIVTLFCVWASYLYVWQYQGGMFIGLPGKVSSQMPILSGACNGTLTLTVAAPLITWLFTVRNGRRYGLEALALNWLNWLVLIVVPWLVLVVVPLG